MTTFGEMFIKSKGQPLEIDGRVVHGIYRREVTVGQAFRLRFIQSVSHPVQGVSLGVKRGVIQVNDVEAKDMVLWCDNAPDDITFVCKKGRGTREFTIWNCWRDERGVNQAWIGNAGMLIEEIRPGIVRFKCNSRPNVTFGDLVFELAILDA